PTGISHMGGMIAAPVAGRIVEETLNYLGVERRYTEKDKNSVIQEAYVPDIRNMTIENAKKKLSESGLEYKIEGSGNNNGTIVDQMPKPNALVPQKSVVILYTYKPADKGATVKVPDLTNKTYYEAAQALNDIGLNIKPDGNGNVVSQSIKPGTDAQKGEIVGVELRHLDTE
ncbi:MAG TPA: PASTA domain-containing protein, partial [Clostridia bacterium]